MTRLPERGAEGGITWNRRLKERLQVRTNH